MLQRAWSCDPDVVTWAAEHAGADRIVIEDQFVTKNSKVPPEKILKLAKHAHFLGGYLDRGGVDVEFVSPKEWKGATRKPKPGVEYVIRRRCRKVLTPAELALVKTDDHDTWDAIGMGLVLLGRAGVGVVTR
jgi:hypothetical protein